ncbi:CBS domain-containing protein [Gymnodinialimonas sp. 57CJ19]|uniref:CBS domain-containing protein n=1 Tax=Gymnodinialimonas sp. 57CJ19 TaxID=3138498 RepID=UPI0031342FCA
MRCIYPDILVARVMSAPVTTAGLDTSVRAAAALMRELGIGALPICDDTGPVGMVTDRDIVTRWATKVASDAPVAEIMTAGVVTCAPEQTVENAAHIMSDAQVRRLVVVAQSGKLVGIITLGDIARDASELLAGETLGEIVEPL